MDPRHYNAWYGIGLVYYKQERFKMAEIFYRKALNINPNSPVLMCHVAVVSLDFLMDFCRAYHSNTSFAIIKGPTRPPENGQSPRDSKHCAQAGTQESPMQVRAGFHSLRERSPRRSSQGVKRAQGPRPQGVPGLLLDGKGKQTSQDIPQRRLYFVSNNFGRFRCTTSSTTRTRP